MKKIKTYLLLAAAAIGMSSCSDFLDQTSPSEITQDAMSESSYYTGILVNRIYGLLTYDYTYSQYIPIDWATNSDCELIDGLGSQATDTSSERGNMNYNADPGWSKISNLWDYMYEAIEYANTAIETVRSSSLLESDDSDERETMERYLGESLTLRAMLYFDLIKFFGDVPMKLETSQSDLSNAYLAKTDRDEIMDSLIVNLEEAIDLLPWAGVESDYTTERVTKGYAHGLLAQIALTRAGWAIRESSKSGYETASYSDATYPTQRPDESTRKELYETALEHLSEIITNSTHNLNPSLENHWYLLNQLTLDETYRENIFEIPMGLAISGELGYRIGVRINGASTYYGDYGNSSGKVKLTAPFFWSYDKNDLRRDLTCANYQLAESSGSVVETMLSNAPFGIYVAKWDIRKMSEEWRQAAIAAGAAKTFTGINPVRLRYAQVLLMYAEVMNELAGGPDASYSGSAGISAREALAEVHCRAFDSSDQTEALAYVNAITGQDDFFDAIVQENAWELAGEGFRKFDLIRWNLLAEKILQFKEDYLYQLENEYPAKVYYNYSDEAKTTIDMSSCTWYEIPENTSSYDANANFWGTYSSTQVETNLPSISSGLIGDDVTVINRYLMPLASTTISASNGTLSNSYGYSN